MPQLTDISVKSATLPAKGTVTLWDGGLKGFGLRISQGGAKTFIVLIGSGRRQKIGRYPLISLATARGEAKRILAEKTLGKIKPTHTAFEDARKDFIADCEGSLRPLTVKLYKRHLTKHYPFGRTGVADLAPKDILKKLKTLKPSEKEHAFRIGRTFFRWCIGQHLLENSPMERLEKPKNGKSRERVLTDAELRAVYKAAQAGTTAFHRLVLLLIHTGQRRGELSKLEWAWITDDTITIPAEVTKNKREHLFVIGKKTQALIKSFPVMKDNPYAFPSVREHVKGKKVTTISVSSKSKLDLDEKCGVSNWTLHDLRRTFRTRWADMEIPREVAERYINHVSGVHSGVDGIYNRAKYIKPMREAALTWEQYLSRLLKT